MVEPTSQISTKKLELKVHFGSFLDHKQRLDQLSVLLIVGIIVVRITHQTLWPDDHATAFGGTMKSLKAVLTVAIAYITFMGAVFLSVSADAMVAQPGQFVASACGAALNQPYLSEVCVGRIAGDETTKPFAAFEFRDNEGRPAVYRVTQVSNLLIKLMSGVRAQIFMEGPNGEQISMQVNRMADGSLKNAHGEIGAGAFEVPTFSPVVHMM